MDKIILVNKEKGFTSRDVVNTLVKTFNEKKIGHFGTLDPLATGLLVIGTGVYTKLGNLLPDESKEYEVEVLLGTSTDTYDITGNILKEEEKDFDESFIKEMLLSFVGEYNQEVPIYSAVKVNGKKLYEYARKGEKVTLPKKEVEIKKIENIQFFEKENKKYLKFKCLVSKGTYIRSLINDLSIKTNTSMCMSNLKRTKCGNFSIENAYTLDEIKNNNYKSLLLENILDIEVLELPKELESLVLNGTMIDKISDKKVLFKKNNINIALYGFYNGKMKPFLIFKN